MKLSRDGWLGIGILLALMLITAAAVMQQNNRQELPYLSTSSSPRGTLALKLWLAELGRPAIEDSQTVFQPRPEIKTIFMIQPIILISEREWNLLDAWIEQGGTLVIAGSNYHTGNAMDHFDFSLRFLDAQAGSISASSPLTNSPAITTTAPVRTDLVLASGRNDFVALFSAAGQPVIISFEQKEGRVILASAPQLLSNLGLKDDATASAVLNMIALTEADGAVWFDEWHHGVQTAAIVGPGQWLRHTPGGHALLFTVGAIFFALLLRGRPFGRPIPLLHEIKRRGPLEHVTAIANLNRKAGHRAEVLQQYHQRVKRHLGRRYRLDPSLADDEYVNLLAQYNTSIDGDALRKLLKRLSQKNASENELLKLTSEAAQWIKE
jgi:hypothetical protein